MTTFPANSSPGGSSSFLLQGMARSTTSPNLTASQADRARAYGPKDATSVPKQLGPRQFQTATSWPAFANNFADEPPMCPPPLTPIRMLYRPLTRPGQP